MEDQLKNLAITEEEDEGLEFADLGNETLTNTYDLCLVGTFVTDRPINFRIMKHRLASLWRPGRGMFVQDLGNKLILFKFYHHHDVRWVMEGGPWTFDNHLLVLHELQPGEDPTEVPLYFVPFWVQINNLPTCFFTETVGKALANHVGNFLSYDEKNKKTADRPYLRVRSMVDIRNPLKKSKKVKKPGSDWITCSFQYEKLSSFCFICGLIGHIDRHCEKFFQTPEEEIVLAWDISLRAPNKRLSNLGGERWLREEDDGGAGVAYRSSTIMGDWEQNKETQCEKDATKSMHASSINVEVGLEISEERKRRRGDENSLAQRVNTESVTSKDFCRMEMDSGSVGKMASQSAASSSSIEVQGYLESGPKNVMMAGPRV